MTHNEARDELEKMPGWEMCSDEKKDQMIRARVMIDLCENNPTWKHQLHEAMRLFKTPEAAIKEGAKAKVKKDKELEAFYTVVAAALAKEAEVTGKPRSSLWAPEEF